MKKRLLKLTLVLFAGYVHASSFFEDTGPVTGRSHQEQLTYFKSLREEEAARLITLPCHTCDNDKRGVRDEPRHGMACADDQEALPCEGARPGSYCCAAVAHEAHLLKVQRLSPQMRERLDLLAKVYAPHGERSLFLPKIEEMLTPFLTPFTGWRKMVHLDHEKAVYCRAVYGYFAGALLREVITHPDLEALGFVSVGLHPLVVPALEGFAQKGSGPKTLSLGHRHVCLCPHGDYGRINGALRQSPFLSRIILECEYLLSSQEEKGRQLQEALLVGTHVKDLTLKGAPKFCCMPLLMDRTLFQGEEECASTTCVSPLGFSQIQYGILQQSALHTLTLFFPERDRRLLASAEFGTFLRENKQLRTLVLYPKAPEFAYGSDMIDAFISNVLCSTSLTNVLFKGEGAQASFGLSDAEWEALEAHLARNRARGEGHAAPFS